MPALNLDWPAIRTLATAIGIVGAAEKMGLTDHLDALYQRSKREGWLRDIPRSQQLPATVLKPVSPVSTPADAMRSALAERGAKSRLALARGLGKAADHVETLEGAKVLEDAQNIKALTSSLATVHAWDSQSGQVRLDLRITADRSVEPPPFIDAARRNDDAFFAHQFTPQISLPLL